MNRSIVCLFAILIFNSVTGQTLPRDSDGKISYSETVKVDSSDADALYRQGKSWVLENFANLKAVLVKDDAQNHLIELRASGECYAPHSFGDTIENGPNAYTLRIEFENDGYKYSIFNFVTKDKWKGDMPAEEIKGSKKQIQSHEQVISELAATLTASLKKSMQTISVIGQ
jgi:hypothetical protein